MAKQTVKPGQTYSRISQLIDIPEEELRRQNPGVSTLKPGQVIKVPRQANFQTPVGNGFTAAQPFTPPAAPIPPVNPAVPTDGRRGRPGEVNQPAPSAFQQIVNTYSQMTPGNLLNAFTQPFQGPTVGSRRPRPTTDVSFGNLGNGTNTVAPQTNLGYYNSPYNGFQTPTSSAAQIQPSLGSSNYLDPRWQQPKPNQAGFQTPTSSAMQTQPFLGSSNYLDPRWQAAQPQTVNSQGKLTRPNAPYTGNPNDPNTALWKNYWNAQATNPGLYAGDTQAQAPQVMTREQIWQMKADQRRRRQDERVPQPQYQFQEQERSQQQQSNPELYRTITWGI